ncbi:MAG: hypothetical protein GXN93_03945 [Candidatus Diapherotrites archaeon]|nr:hypothetical protein [Candidatus Diapherotrites archaeon]
MFRRMSFVPIFVLLLSLAHASVVIQNKDLNIINGSLSISGGNLYVSGTATVGDLSCSHCVALGSETSGNYVAGITAGTGISVSGGSGVGATPQIAIAHPSIACPSGQAIQSFDLGAGTKVCASFISSCSACDSRFVNVTGDTMSGTLTVPTLYVGNTGTKIIQGENNALKIVTPSGDIEIGPQNAQWAHIITDRGNFYFNKGAAFSGTVRPYTNNVSDLGTATYHWRNIYGGILYVYGRPSTPNGSYLTLGGEANGIIMSFPRVASSNDNAFLYAYQSGPNAYDLRLYLQDDQDDTERFSIWGGSCAHGGCSQSTANAVVQHYWTAAGNAYHRGNLTIGGSFTMPAGKKLCLDGSACSAYIYYDATNKRMVIKVS